MPSLIRCCIPALACAVAFAANASTVGSVKCGGAGSDARMALEQSQANANLELEFFVGKRGAYVADVDVTVTPTGGGEAFSTTTDGPLCFAQLSPGRYRIEATYKGVTRLASANVGANGKVHLAMGFPESVAEPDPAPVSEEEKRQASTQ